MTSLCWSQYHKEHGSEYHLLGRPHRSQRAVMRFKSVSDSVSTIRSVEFRQMTVWPMHVYPGTQSAQSPSTQSGLYGRTP